MSGEAQRNMELVKGWLTNVVEMSKSKDPAKIRAATEALYTADYCLHDPSTPDLKPGLEANVTLMIDLLTSINDMHLRVDGMFAADDKVVTRGIYDFIDPASQERKNFAVLVISRFEGAKIAEEWQLSVPLPVEAQSW